MGGGGKGSVRRTYRLRFRSPTGACVDGRCCRHDRGSSGAPASEAPVALLSLPAEAETLRRTRPTTADVIADSPVPAFISSPGLFTKEQTTRPVGGVRGARFNMTGDAACAIDANPDSGDLVKRTLREGIYQQSSPVPYPTCCRT